MKKFLVILRNILLVILQLMGIIWINAILSIIVAVIVGYSEDWTVSQGFAAGALLTFGILFASWFQRNHEGYYQSDYTKQFWALLLSAFVLLHLVLVLRPFGETHVLQVMIAPIAIGLLEFFVIVVIPDEWIEDVMEWMSVDPDAAQ